MPDDTPQPVMHRQIAKIVGSGFATDNSQVGVKFEDEHGDVFMLTLPMKALGDTATEFVKLRIQAANRSLAAGAILSFLPRSWSIGSNPDQRGYLALQIDLGTVNEQYIWFTDANAMAIATEMKRNIHLRMTPQDVAARRKLILPPGVQ